VVCRVSCVCRISEIVLCLWCVFVCVICVCVYFVCFWFV